MKKSLYNLTQEIITELSSVNILFDKGKEVNLIKEFKKIPRSGKAVRINKYNLNLPKQSILDHTFQVALIADLLTETLKQEVDNELLPYIIAIHDLPEVITGDIPDFTAEGQYFQRTNGDLKYQEEMAANLITEQLSGDLKRLVKRAFDRLHSEGGELKLFHLADKIEPIISTWRYVFCYKDIIDINLFLEAMTDFFTNPKIVTYSLNQDTLEVVNYLQTKKNLLKYYNTGRLNINCNLFTDSEIKKLIEFRQIDSI